MEGALPREEAPRSVVAVVTLEVGGPGWGALRTQGWHTAEAATGGPRQGGWDGVPGLGRAP